jgi:hypothetical protein
VNLGGDHPNARVQLGGRIEESAAVSYCSTSTILRASRAAYWFAAVENWVDASRTNGLSWAPRWVTSPYDLEHNLGELLQGVSERGVNARAATSGRSAKKPNARIVNGEREREREREY